MIKCKIVLFVIMSVILAACSPVEREVTEFADLIFIGDNIITMDNSEVTAVAVRGDRIVATGGQAEVIQLQDDSTRLVELGDRALLPGFIDAHGHFGAVATSSALLDLSSPPVGAVETIDDIVTAIQNWIENNDVPDGQLIYGFGYDDSLLAEQRHPNRDDLDRASTSHPIVIRHVSGHLNAANSMALAQSRITAESQSLPGGVIRRRSDSDEPIGVMEETAMGLLPGYGALISEEQGWQLRRDAAEIYSSYGITCLLYTSDAADE